MGYLGYLPLLVSGLSAAGSLYGGIQGASAAKGAARTQAQSADAANKLLAEIYAQQQAALEPYRQLGYASLGELLQRAQQQPAVSRFALQSYTPPVATWSWYRPPGVG